MKGLNSLNVYTSLCILSPSPSPSPTLTVDEFLLRDNTVVVDIQGLEELDGPGKSMRNYSTYRETFSPLISGGPSPSYWHSAVDNIS
jgi:hypothetical protein